MSNDAYDLEGEFKRLQDEVQRLRDEVEVADSDLQSARDAAGVNMEAALQAMAQRDALLMAARHVLAWDPEGSKGRTTPLTLNESIAALRRAVDACGVKP